MDTSTADLAWPDALKSLRPHVAARPADPPAAPVAPDGLAEEVASAQAAYLALLSAHGQGPLATRIERVARAHPLDLEALVAILEERLEPIVYDYTAGTLIDLDDYEDDMSEVLDALIALDSWRQRASGQLTMEGL